MKKNKKNLVPIILLILLAVGVGGFYTKRQFSKNPITPSTTPQEIINFAPTDQDKKDAENHKAQLSAPNNTPTPSSTTVTPIITSWGQSDGKVEVAARVPGIFEEGGLCTLILKRNNETQTGTSTGIANVSEVSCGFIAISRSNLTAGEWTATIAYSSPAASGTSESKTIRVE